VGGALLLGLVRRSWLEGALDVVLHEPTLSECVLDGDLVVRARRVQELLEVVPSRLCFVGISWMHVRQGSMEVSQSENIKWKEQ
jgi:hypothetical protein